jgi:Mlc titration factor MtfA (ptsG expression regulator)
VTAVTTLILIVIVVVVGLFYPGWRRKQILNKPFPSAWLDIITKRLPFFKKLKADEQKQLLGLIQLFLASKTFYGCNGLEINDDIRVTIAAEACLLLLNRKTPVYPRLKYILVYPSAFLTDNKHYNQDGTIGQNIRTLLGESWHHGKIILSWDDVTYGAGNIHDGHNVSLHEFAHQLDSESGSANGAPLLGKELGKNAYQSWARILTEEYEELHHAIEHHHKTVMDSYGATNPAEFFAVATETFFEKPQQMKKHHPELFEELRKFYQVNPADWQ